jgi:hypothetical protein
VSVAEIASGSDSFRSRDMLMLTPGSDHCCGASRTPPDLVLTGQTMEELIASRESAARDVESSRVAASYAAGN